MSPTAASRAVAWLTDQELIRREDAVIVAGRPRHVHLLHANRLHPRYQALARTLAKVEPPKADRDDAVPARLKHPFWNTNPAQLNVAHGGEYIARRLLRTLDPVGLGVAVDVRAPGMLRIYAGETKIEFFHADEVRPQHLLVPPSVVADLQVADIRDLMAMKLKVLAEHGELRDYYDVKEIEEREGVSIEEGTALFCERYGLDRASSAIRQLIVAPLQVIASRTYVRIMFGRNRSAAGYHRWSPPGE